MSRILIILTVLLTIFFSGCTNSTVKIEKEEITTGSEFLYMEEVYAHAKNSFSSGEWEKSLEWYERLNNDYPENPYIAESLFIRGYIENTLNEDKETAAKYFEELIKNYPDSEFCNSAKFELEHIDDPGFLPEFKK